MIRIVIYSSSADTAGEVFGNAAEVLKYVRVQCEVSYITDITKITSKLTENVSPWDIYILDASDEKGIAAAKLIRSRDLASTVIFISPDKNMKDWLKYRPSALITDIGNVAELRGALLFACSEQRRRRNYFVIKSRERVFRIRCADILFFESEKRQVTLYTDKDCYVFYAKLSDVLEDLPPADFIRCHQSYIVNIDKIDELDKTNRSFRVKDADRLIEISKANYKDVVRIYEERIGIREKVPENDI